MALGTIGLKWFGPAPGPARRGSTVAGSGVGTCGAARRFATGFIDDSGAWRAWKRVGRDGELVGFVAPGTSEWGGGR